MSTIVFNDATEVSVQDVKSYGDYLLIKSLVAPAQLRTMFEDPLKTSKIQVKERGQIIAEYEGYTQFYRTEEYTGQIYGVTMYRPERTPETQAELQQAAVLVAQIRAQELTDEQAVQVKAIYPAWSPDGVHYPVDYKVLYNDVLYKSMQDHTSQADWAPDNAPSLWAKVLAGQEGTGIGEWEQPDSTNPYMTGDQVTHNGKTWESLVDNNVWEPGVQGTEALWQQVEE